MSVRLPLCFAVLSFLNACGDDSQTEEETAPDAGGARSEDAPDAEVTYHGHVRAILDHNCVSCHVEGGIGPMPLDDIDDVYEYRALVVAAASSGQMPPWPASDECHELRDVRSLADDDIAVLEAWREADYPEGDEKDYQPAEQGGLGVPEREPDLVLKPAESYLPNPALTDEYRCFLTEGTFEEDTYLTGMDIRPGNRSEVHHVQVHKVAVSQIPTIQAIDAAAEGVGYPCGGGAGQGVASVNMFSWRPGSSAILFEEGDAALVEGGSAFVLQVHYNTQYLPEDGPAPDLSGVAFWTLPKGELPARIVTRRGVFGPVGPDASGTGFGGVIPAGESHVVGESTTPMSQLSTVNRRYVQGEITGMTPHMHTLGTRLSATLMREGDGACMIDVPDWDFEWQLDYAFANPVSYGPNDQLTVRCEYDNSPENQPYLDGRQITPRDVTWGEGSLDEMCLNYVWLRFERDAFIAAYGQ